jgi:signal transduction histidine kinase
MKPANLILIYFFMVSAASAQSDIVDSFKNKLSISKPDTNRINLLVAWAEYYNDDNSDSVIMLSRQGIELAQKLHYPKGEARCLLTMGNGYKALGNYIQAIQFFQQALQLSKEINDTEGKARALCQYAFIYWAQDDFRKELSCYLEAEQLARKLNNLPILITAIGQAGKACLTLNQLDSAGLYLHEAYELLKTIQFNHPKAVVFITSLGDFEANKGHSEIALAYYRQALPISMKTNTRGRLSNTYMGLANIYLHDNQIDSALTYAQIAFDTARKASFSMFNLSNASQYLSEIYERLNNYKEALHYKAIAAVATDSILSRDKLNQLSNVIYNEQLRQSELKTAREKYQSQVKLNTLLVTLVAILIAALLLYRNNRQKQKAKTKIEKAYDELKSTQAQLVQREKMASLGELTAGIAHEIQNPLNFVNNFSEVSIELVDELKNEATAGNKEEVIAIADDIAGNLEKVVNHGKRADSIVKSMMEHSRSTKGEIQPTDINALADEYLRLAYHGMRAKDKSFNAVLETHFDESISKINVVPQDIGRVLINLYNNAFYAVAEKKKQLADKYESVVSVTTKKDNDKVLVSVSDNGSGIPEKVKDKIFQPFFTTKPTGQGTGLGLSLSYDIIKAHGGEIKVETKEGEGSEFIIQLSLKA